MARKMALVPPGAVCREKPSTPRTSLPERSANQMIVTQRANTTALSKSKNSNAPLVETETPEQTIQAGKAQQITTPTKQVTLPGQPPGKPIMSPANTPSVTG